MPINPSHIVQIAVPIQDLDRAKRFYGETLGLTHLFDAPPSLAFYQCGETRLMLSPPSEEEVAKASILYYSVPDARTAEAALAADGAEIVTPAHFLARVGGKDIWLAIARDSEANLLGLMSEEAAAA
ncbi:MAG TPA: VOC family protein [Allosphingosinicella sp.]|nr:VOC family protein [Allosphingosinicella sp.]